MKENSVLNKLEGEGKFILDESLSADEVLRFSRCKVLNLRTSMLDLRIHRADLDYTLSIATMSPTLTPISSATGSHLAVRRNAIGLNLDSDMLS